MQNTNQIIDLGCFVETLLFKQSKNYKISHKIKIFRYLKGVQGA